MGEHDGHRERLRTRFLASGGEGVTDAELLELALFVSIPRRDVRPLAESLLRRFGSLTAIFDASAAELCEIAGVGEHSALLLGILGCCRDMARSRGLAGTRLTGRGIRDLLLTNLRGAERDKYLAVYLGQDGTVAALRSSSVPERPDSAGLAAVIVNQARLIGSSALYLGRGLGGPGGVPDMDLSLAIGLRRELERAGITLRDYIVVTPTDYLPTVSRLSPNGTSFRLPDGRGPKP